LLERQVIVQEERGENLLHSGGTNGKAPRLEMRQREREELWARTLIVVSVEREGRLRVSRIRVGWVE
jgi:hypothetical protein